MSQVPVSIAYIEEVFGLRKRVTAMGHFVGHSGFSCTVFAKPPLKESFTGEMRGQ